MATANDAAGSPSPGGGLHVPERRLAGLGWWALTAAVAGLLLGGWLGSRYGFERGDPNGGWLNPGFGTLVTTIGLEVVLGVVGVILAILRSTRPLGIGVLAGVVFILVGFPVGEAMGPRWRPGQSGAGTVAVELTSPVSARLEAPATCTTLPNAVRIGEIEARPLGKVGSDELYLSIYLAPGPVTQYAAATIRLGVNTGSGYEGLMRIVEAADDRKTGMATFTELGSDSGWIGGTRQPLTGSMSWSCTGGASSTLVDPFGTAQVRAEQQGVSLERPRTAPGRDKQSTRSGRVVRL